MGALLPLLVRELRGQSRQIVTYWLRVVAVAALLFCLVPISVEMVLGEQIGRFAFNRMNSILFACIWIFVPLLVADCISREKREGTLGLLFLTRLHGGSIIAAKGLAHGLRASTLLIASLPILAIPLLLGGVAFMDIVCAFILNAAAMLCALLSGLIASVLATRWSRAITLTVLLGIVMLHTFLTAHSIILDGIAAPSFPLAWQRATAVGDPGPVLPAGPAWRGNVGVRSPVTGMAQVIMTPGRPLPPTAIKPSMASARLWAAVQMLGLSATELLLFWLMAGRALRGMLSASGPTKTQRALERRFCTPIIWKERFRRSLRRSLERNPIGWLEQYSWSARLTKWGWCLAVLIFEISAFNNAFTFDSYQHGGPWLFPVLIGAMALSACNSFARERESGALELLLVSPLTERQIIGGRLMGLWMQVLPALAFYVLMFEAFHVSSREKWAVTILRTALCTSIIGLCLSMTRLNLFVRWLATMVAVFIPIAVGLGELQIIIAVIAFAFLHEWLKARQFTVAGPLQREISRAEV